MITSDNRMDLSDAIENISSVVSFLGEASACLLLREEPVPETAVAGLDLIFRDVTTKLMATCDVILKG